MRNPFYTVVHQVCQNQWCSLNDQPVDLQAPSECAECRGRLTRVRRFEIGRVLRAVATLAAFGVGILLVWKLDTMAGPILNSFKRSLDQQTVALDSTARTELASLFRAAYRDEEITAAEREAIDRAASERKLQPSDVAKLEQELRPRVIAATRSLSAAKRHIDARRLDEAVREYRQAAASDPEDPIAWAGLAAAYTLEGEEKAAEDAYQQALTLDPDNWLANYNVGLAAERRGESEVALEHFRRALGSLRVNGPEHRAVIAELRTVPELRGLRGDPRFAALLEKR